MKGLAFTVRGAQVTLPVVAGMIVGLQAGRIYPHAFFETAAQVIPVLLLALVVDLGALVGFPPITLDISVQNLAKLEEALQGWLTAMLGVLTLIVGEIISLLAIANGHASWKWEQGVVLAACFAGLTMIGVRGVSLKRKEEGSAPPETGTVAASGD